MRLGLSNLVTSVRDSVLRPLMGDIDQPTQNVAKPVSAAPIAQPLPPGGSDVSYDGDLVGANGQTFPPNTPIESLPAVMPKNGKAGNETVVFVNGVGESHAGLSGEMQQVADATGEPVVSVYNATEGTLKDFLQTIEGRFDIGKNPAVDSLADVVYQHVKSGQPIRIAGYSQGGLIVSRALSDVKQRLMNEDGMSEADATKRLGLVTAETFAGAASSYPDGPKYTHYVNKFDPVQLFSFYAFGDNPPNPLVHQGAGAKTVSFDYFGWKAHDLGVYLSHYQRS